MASETSYRPLTFQAVEADTAVKFLSCLLLTATVISTTAGVFDGGLWAGAAIGAAVVAVAYAWIIDHHYPRPRQIFLMCWLACVTLVWLSMAWSFSIRDSWLYSLRVLGFLTPLLFWSSPALLSRIDSKWFFKLTPWLIIVTSLLITLEIKSGGVVMRLIYRPDTQLTVYDRGFSYLVLFSFPIFAALWIERRRKLAMALLAALLIGVASTLSRATQAGVVASVLVMAAAFMRPRFTRRVLAVLIFCLTPWPFAARWIFLHHRSWLAHIPNSWRDRVEIWDYLSYRITDRPWLGWGVGTIPRLDFMHPHGHLYLVRVVPATHGHNFMTQLWVEAGLPGVILGWTLALVALLQISRLPRVLAPYATGAWTMALSLLCVSYNFWTDSLFSVFVMTGVGFVLLAARLKPATELRPSGLRKLA